MSLIDWCCLNYVLPKQKNKKQLIKGLHHLWNTMTPTFKWGKSKTNPCPLCSNKIENWQHVLQCENKHIIRTHTELVTTLEHGLKSLHSDPELQKYIICGLKSWLSANTVEEPAAYNISNVKIHEAYQAPQQIGFDNFMQGLIATEI